MVLLQVVLLLAVLLAVLLAALLAALLPGAHTVAAGGAALKKDKNGAARESAHALTTAMKG